MKEESNSITINALPSTNPIEYWMEDFDPKTAMFSSTTVMGATETDQKILTGCKDYLFAFYRAMMNLENETNAGSSTLHYICGVEVNKDENHKTVKVSFEKRHQPEPL